MAGTWTYQGCDSVTTGTADNTVWTSWVTSSTSTTGDVTVWRSRCSDSTTATASNEYQLYVREIGQPTLTAEQIEAVREAEREHREQMRREAEEAALEREQAQAKAQELLNSLLSPEQRDQLEKQSAFVVRSEMDRLYRIKRGRSMNIEELDESGKAVARLCIHPNEMVPNEDTMVAQMLMLQANEAEFRRVANRSPIS